MCLLTDGLLHIYLRLVFPGFQHGATPEAAEGCNYMLCNNKTKQMRGELHQTAYKPGRMQKLHGVGFFFGWGGGVKPEMRVMDALRLNTSKSPLQAALFLPGSVSECVRESVQD